MQNRWNSFKVLLYWNKITWYALGALTSSLNQYHIPYEIIKGDALKAVETAISHGNRVIFSESSRNMTLNALAKRLKKLKQHISSSDLITIIGGPQASGDPESILQLGADYIVIGEGEVTFPELILTLVAHDFNRASTVDVLGIAYQDSQGNVIKTPRRPKITLDDHCPYSDSDKFPLHPPIELMRGCAFRCRFCQVPYMYGNPRFRSIENLTKVVEHYVKHFTPIKQSVDIRFIAPNSLGYMEKKRGIPNVPALHELITRLNHYDIRLFLGTFPSEVRPEYLTESTINLFDAVYNRHISVGFQSGSDRILHEMRRRHTVADGLNSFDIILSHGYKPVFDFIIGSPSETEDEQWETIDIMKELGKKAQVRLHYFMPLPGTPWRNSVPTPIYPQIQSEIGRLAQQEVVMGDFGRQFQFTFLNHQK